MKVMEQEWMAVGTAGDYFYHASPQPQYHQEDSSRIRTRVGDWYDEEVKTGLGDFGAGKVCRSNAHETERKTTRRRCCTPVERKTGATNRKGAR